LANEQYANSAGRAVVLRTDANFGWVNRFMTHARIIQAFIRIGR